MMMSARLAIASLAAALLAGCAAAPNRDDPIEPFNRGMYAVHEVVDGKVVKPIAQAYVDYVPDLVRRPIHNFFSNIDDLFSAISGLGSGKLDSAGHDLGRVMVNTLFGIGGLIDVASEGNIPKGNLDFGLMFGAWGIPQGPYLFVPVWGPTTVRDGTGSLLRLYVGPAGYINDVPVRNVIYGVGALDARAAALDTEKLIDQAALDKYAFIRRAYLQRRQYLLYGGNPPPAKEEE
jgi:phospholipid-binding lipoprotein MlaA